MTANNLTLKKSLITASKRLLRTAAPSCLAVKQIPSCLAFMVFVLRPKCVCARRNAQREREREEDDVSQMTTPQTRRQHCEKRFVKHTFDEEEIIYLRLKRGLSRKEHGESRQRRLACLIVFPIMFARVTVPFDPPTPLHPCAPSTNPRSRLLGISFKQLHKEHNKVNSGLC